MGKTKAEEREALAKIREILEGFDPEETYIGKAFEGCVEQADENLRSGLMMSYKSCYDSVSEKLHAANVRITELTKTLNQKDDAIARLKDANGQFSKEIDQKDAECMDLRGKVWEAEALIGDLRQTILELKAKLYDMIMAGGEVKG